MARFRVARVLNLFFRLGMGFLHRPPIAEIDVMEWYVQEQDAADRRVRFVAIVCNPIIALATFDAAAEHWPDKRFVCRHGARILKQYPPRAC